ncbi:Oligo-1,6-glucosidase [Bacillus subtilis subsp. subtilis]|uniref:Oligo-1,6-glucosidase n=1 Tax=Bacillus subtilis subsp. subtilis TaxID=135461 RepID=A0ABD3ZZ21_BACIU|nr:Oligo-1,6-glucosidase [Bacillus subtilis subsp. subtilis]
MLPDDPQLFVYMRENSKQQLLSVSQSIIFQKSRLFFSGLRTAAKLRPLCL